MFFRSLKTYRTLEGGELAPKVVLGKLGLLTPNLRIFYRTSVERGQIQGPPKIENFHPPSSFRRFDPPPIPVSNLPARDASKTKTNMYKFAPPSLRAPFVGTLMGLRHKKRRPQSCLQVPTLFHNRLTNQQKSCLPQMQPETFKEQCLFSWSVECLSCHHMTLPGARATTKQHWYH